MKTTTFALLLLAAFSFSACQKITQTTSFTGNVPLYMSYDELRTSIANDNDRSLEHPGKIVLYNDWILINELEQGIHIYDNSNPSAPQHMAFISIPGNIDMSIQNGVLYADSYVDLVALDLSTPSAVKEVGRTENVFSYTIPTLNMDENYPVARIDQTQGVVIGYEVRDVEETCEDQACFHEYTIERSNDGWFGGMGQEDEAAVTFGDGAANVRSSASSPNSSIAGSMARFLTVGEHLYAISSEEEIKVFQLGNADPIEVAAFRPWSDAGRWGIIETLFRLNDNLFIGSNNGILIYDVSSTSSPQYLSHYQHLTACDPVIANEQYAFVTLHGGTACGWQDINELQALDVSNIMEPALVTTMSMDRPQGLTMDDGANLLFVCDGLSGVRTIDFSELQNAQLVQLDQTTGFDAYDVILKDRRLHVIGSTGLLQFNYTTDGKLHQISSLDLH
jgi:hypothetical protein